MPADITSNLPDLNQLLYAQSRQGDPNARLLGMMPSLGYSIGAPQGFMAKPMMSYAAFGRGGSLRSVWQGVFVPMDSIAKWSTQGLENVSANIEAPQIDPPHIDAPHISGMPIEGQEIRGVLIDAPHISAPAITVPSTGHGAAMVV